MADNTQYNKLDEVVKSTLNGYEAPYDPSDWSKMESMLQNTPKSVNFKWSSTLTIIVGVCLLVGGYLVYNTISPSSKQENETSKAIENAVVVPAPPTINNVKPVPAPATVVPAPENSIVPPAASNEKPIVPAAVENKTATVKEKSKEKNQKVIAQDSVEVKITKMGNEPVFGDMLDSSKGIIRETKEKEETKKAAKVNKDVPIGWDNFMLKNVNPDSLRKNRERKDSLKE